MQFTAAIEAACELGTLAEGVWVDGRRWNTGPGKSTQTKDALAWQVFSRIYSGDSGNLNDVKGEKSSMCMSCGCGQINDNHGDSRHLTMMQIEQAAKAAGTTPEQVAKNIQKGVDQALRQQR